MAKKLDIMEVRRKNLANLIAQWGGPTTLAKKLRLAGPSYLSQLIGENRPITEKTARKYEAALGLPGGWLDDDRPNNAKPATVDDRLMTRALLLVGAALEEAKINLKPSKFADLVAMVYEEAVRAGELSEDFVKRLVNLTK